MLVSNYFNTTPRPSKYTILCCLQLVKLGLTSFNCHLEYTNIEQSKDENIKNAKVGRAREGTMNQRINVNDKILRRLTTQEIRII